MKRYAVKKAMLLAAGLGTRLKPLTNTIPKPMLPVAGRPLINFALARLARAGVRDVMINLHHLPEQIRRHVGTGNAFGLRAHYSLEPQILGTGGGLKQCEGFFGDDPFLLMNADTLIALDLNKLIDRHFDRGGIGTLVVRKRHAEDPYRPLAVDAHGRLAGFGTGTHFYAGVQIGTAALLRQLPSGRPSCLIADGIEPLLAGNRPFWTFLHTGEWNDVGTPDRYALAQTWAW
ncbi:MAG: nucleotidyltransferase family protein [Deltaproteobacteria bacterium]|nr:nucleotidyltransferase family protein [Deltaproteobacteria bacterium]